MRLRVTSFGTEAVNRELLGIEGRILDAEPAMEAIIDQLRISTRKQFDSQGAYGSGGWAPLAASTVQHKARNSLDPRILRATGALFRSLTQPGGAAVAIATADGVEFGSTLDYGQYHQTGTSRMPARPPMQLPERDRRECVKILQRYVIEGSTSAGGGRLRALRGRLAGLFRRGSIR